MAEAAIVLPIIILVVMTSVLIILFFYSQAVNQSELHMSLRKDAAASNELLSNPFSKHKVSDSRRLIMDHKGILTDYGRFCVEGSSYLFDGPEYVRYCNIIKGQNGDE